MAAGSIPFIVQYAIHGADISQIELLDSPLAVALATYFITYLWSDAFIGFFFYRGAFDCITGWVHHALYSVIVLFTIVFSVPGAFLIAGILELPTVFLSVGHVWKRLRFDAGFGITFFITRIAFHVYFVWTLHTSWPDQAFWVLGAVVFVRQQIRLKKERTDREAQAALDGNSAATLAETDLNEIDLEKGSAGDGGVSSSSFVEDDAVEDRETTSVEGLRPSKED
ncbi:hypothetical protein HK101_005442 [Irineochytrium annulatum]|nr:hypothetical protein HK101_005442 [Irineochytrium annulatum]